MLVYCLCVGIVLNTCWHWVTEFSAGPGIASEHWSLLPGVTVRMSETGLNPHYRPLTSRVSNITIFSPWDVQMLTCVLVGGVSRFKHCCGMAGVHHCFYSLPNCAAQETCWQNLPPVPSRCNAYSRVWRCSEAGEAPCSLSSPIKPL